MIRTLCRNLGKVSDTDDLTFCSDKAEFFTDGFPHFTADVGVDFVKNQHRYLIVRREHYFDRQHHS